MNTLVIGHRGDPARYPDNSLAGILGARAVADMVEIDVRRTADRVAVLSHDPQVGGKTLVEHSFAEFAEVDIGDGHRLGRFDQLLTEIGDFPLNIEIKNWADDPDFDPTHEFALEIAGRARPIDLVTCFDWDTMSAIKAELPEVATGLLIDTDQGVEGAMRRARAEGHRALSVAWTVFPEDPQPVVDEAAELEIYAWTVNDLDVARSFATAGLRGVITNDPAGVRQALQEMP